MCATTLDHATATPRSAAALAARPKPPRRHELDWMRSLVVLGLIPFHVAIIFTTSSTDYVKNTEASPVLILVASFISYWGMPLLFFVAGAGAWFALEFRSARRYTLERFSRLVVPFVFGVLAIVPVQVYFGYLTNPAYHDSYLTFYVDHLQRFWLLLQGLSGGLSNTLFGHLWFIPILLLFSLAALPLFLWLKQPRGLQEVHWLGAVCGRPAGIFLLVLPVAAIDLFVHTVVPEFVSVDSQMLDGVSGVFLYLFVFLFGYIFYADPRVVASVRRVGIWALVLGAASWLIVQAVFTGPSTPQTTDLARYAAFVLLRAYTSWFWILFILWLAVSFFTRSNALLRFLSDSAYPVYVLHMPVLTIVGFYVVGWPVGIPAKYLFITIVTVVITLAIYGLVIRQSRVLRVLFGMKAPERRGRGPKRMDGQGRMDAPVVADATPTTPATPVPSMSVVDGPELALDLSLFTWPALPAAGGMAQPGRPAGR